MGRTLPPTRQILWEWRDLCQLAAGRFLQTAAGVVGHNRRGNTTQHLLQKVDIHVQAFGLEEGEVQGLLLWVFPFDSNEVRSSWRVNKAVNIKLWVGEVGVNARINRG